MTFIIAEIGSNFTSIDEAKDSISIAKNCDADAVKFQLFSEHDLYGSGSKQYNIDPKDLEKLKQKADAVKIEFMCTAFSLAGLNIVDPLVSRHKLASSELTHLLLLQQLELISKPVIASVGASSLDDIARASKILGSTDTTFLYCMVKYPATNVNLFGIDKLKQTYTKVGYSCHTTDWYTPVAAVHKHGAVVIEKHFKLKDMNTPDNAHSLLPDDFKKMVKAIRGNPLDYVFFPDPQEIDAIELYNRRIIAVKDIANTKPIDPADNIGIYRTKVRDREGLSPFSFLSLSGKTAAKDIKALEPIGPKVIK